MEFTWQILTLGQSVVNLLLPPLQTHIFLPQAHTQKLMRQRTKFKITDILIVSGKNFDCAKIKYKSSSSSKSAKMG